MEAAGTTSIGGKRKSRAPVDAGSLAHETISRARGRKDKDKEDGAAIKIDSLKNALRELGIAATKAALANAELKEMIKTVAKQSGLLSSVVRAMTKAQQGDSDDFNDTKRKVEQLAIVFEEIGWQGEITKETAQ